MAGGTKDERTTVATTLKAAEKQMAALRELFDRGTRDDGTAMTREQLRSVWHDMLSLSIYVGTIHMRRGEKYVADLPPRP